VLADRHVVDMIRDPNTNTFIRDQRENATLARKTDERALASG